jgi:hypothetical protein
MFDRRFLVKYNLDTEDEEITVKEKIKCPCCGRAAKDPDVMCDNCKEEYQDSCYPALQEVEEK